jgi:hypothetical protein
MSFDNPDFIVKCYKDKKTGKVQRILRRYKGNDSVVVVPDGVEEISDYCFADDVEPNTVITKIIIPDSVVHISENAFAWCKTLKEIKFPNKLEEFFIYFNHCPALEELTVPDSVRKITNIHCNKTLKKINVGENITEVALTMFKKHQASSITPWSIADVLLKNPVYVVEGEFLVNKKHETTLFRVDLEKTEVRVPDGIKTIGSNSFYELYQYNAFLASKMKPVEKIIIPASVSRINDQAFFNCNSLKEVIYEGYSKALDVSKWAFFMCYNFHKDGREIICKDSPKPKKENSKSTNLRFDRLILIHRMIKRGAYPKLEEIVNACRYELGMGTCSESTVNRDLAILRNRFGAPIKYDAYSKGYYYTDKKFTIDFDSLDWV